MGKEFGKIRFNLADAKLIDSKELNDGMLVPQTQFKLNLWRSGQHLYRSRLYFNDTQNTRSMSPTLKFVHISNFGIRERRCPRIEHVSSKTSSESSAKHAKSVEMSIPLMEVLPVVCARDKRAEIW